MPKKRWETLIIERLRFDVLILLISSSWCFSVSCMTCSPGANSPEEILKMAENARSGSGQHRSWNVERTGSNLFELISWFLTGWFMLRNNVSLISSRWLQFQINVDLLDPNQWPKFIMILSRTTWYIISWDSIGQDAQRHRCWQCFLKSGQNVRSSGLSPTLWFGWDKVQRRSWKVAAGGWRQEILLPNIFRAVVRRKHVR